MGILVTHFPMKLKTRRGFDAVIYFDKASIDYPYLGMYFTEGEWYPHRWTSNGSAHAGTETDLDVFFVTPAPTLLVA